MSSPYFFKHLSVVYSVLKPRKVPNTFGGKIFACTLSTYRETFKFSELEITTVEPSQRKKKPDPNKLLFGQEFCDHMFEVKWDAEGGWGIPRICQLHNLDLHPAAKVLHYSQEIFEGMKAYRNAKDEVLLFRPTLNIERLMQSSERLAFPSFDGNELLKCLKKLVSIDRDWVPKKDMCSLYIRPCFIGTEGSLGVAASRETLLYIITGPVGPYFTTGVRDPISLFADSQYIRAWPGGIGDKKSGSNYGPTIYVQNIALKRNLQQVLWLFGNDHQLTEVGTMNIFVYLINENGEKELVTPPLNGIILPGVVRRSVLELVREWNEFKVSERIITMKEVINAVKQNRILEIFGTGTACVVCPVCSIEYLGQSIAIPYSDNDLNARIFNTLLDIQYGKVPSSWIEKVEN